MPWKEPSPRSVLRSLNSHSDSDRAPVNSSYGHRRRTISPLSRALFLSIYLSVSDVGFLSPDRPELGFLGAGDGGDDGGELGGGRGESSQLGEVFWRDSGEAAVVAAVEGDSLAPGPVSAARLRAPTRGTPGRPRQPRAEAPRRVSLLRSVSFHLFFHLFGDFLNPASMLLRREFWK